MKLGEFRHPVMAWSMYDDAPVEPEDRRIMREGLWNDDYLESPEGKRRCLEAHLAQELELDAPQGAPDGFHDFTIGQEGEESPAFTGILVQNGKFAPHTSASAIYLAQCRREGVAALNWGRRVVWVHHRFIEALEWRGDHFRVSLGS